MGEHTPGPWFAADHYCGRDPETAGEEYAATRLIKIGSFDSIAEVRHGHDDIPGDVDANARLIAAAPDLLETLEYLADLPASQLNLAEPWLRARAAIARATGAA